MTKMANTEISERAKLFEYGLLTSRTSKTISKIRTTEKLPTDAHSRTTLEQAIKFIDTILSEEKFVSGEYREEEIAPDFDRLTTLSRAMTTLEVLEPPLTSSKEIQDLLKDIKKQLDSILNSSVKNFESLEFANSFFSTISNMMLEELSRLAAPNLTLR